MLFGLERLPDQLPVFPLTGALLLPKGHLPLNIFESRYLDMVYYAREKNGLVGMIQPATSPLETHKGNDQFGTAERNRPLYTTGCVGMISDLKENNTGGLMIILTGLSRFDIVAEVPRTQTFREMRVQYERFAQDCAEPSRSDDIRRDDLLGMAGEYLKRYNIMPDWSRLAAACDEELVNGIAMMCPFDAAEKQAVLEIINLKDRVDLLLRMMTFDLSGAPQGAGGKTLQ